MTYFLFIVGLGLFYLVNRRKFNRRNAAGLEEYKSFENAVGNNIINKILKIVAYMFIIAGIGNCAKHMDDKPKVDNQIESKNLKK